jgi:hypothetical protein
MALALGILACNMPLPEPTAAEGQYPPAPSSEAYDEETLADVIVTTDDIEGIIPGIWRETSHSPPEFQVEWACGLDCSGRVWMADYGELTVAVMRHADSGEAEDVLKDLSVEAMEGLGFEQEFLPRSEYLYLPDHTWIGTLFDEKFSAIHLLSQAGKFIVSVATYMAKPLEPNVDRTPYIHYLSLIAERQWEKLAAAFGLDLESQGSSPSHAGNARGSESFAAAVREQPSVGGCLRLPQHGLRTCRTYLPGGSQRSADG